MKAIFGVYTSLTSTTFSWWDRRLGRYTLPKCLGSTTFLQRSTVVWTKTCSHEDRTNKSSHSSRSCSIHLQNPTLSINLKTCTSLRKKNNETFPKWYSLTLNSMFFRGLIHQKKTKHFGEGLGRWDPIPESGTQSYQTSPFRLFRSVTYQTSRRSRLSSLDGYQIKILEHHGMTNWIYNEITHHNSQEVVNIWPFSSALCTSQVRLWIGAANFAALALCLSAIYWKRGHPKPSWPWRTWDIGFDCWESRHQTASWNLQKNYLNWMERASLSTRSPIKLASNGKTLSDSGLPRLWRLVGRNFSSIL